MFNFLNLEKYFDQFKNINERYKKRSRSRKRYVFNNEWCHNAGKLPKPVKPIKRGKQ